MDGKWGTCGIGALLLCIIAGCRTPPPTLKPIEQPEVLNKPPQEARFNNPGMPREAYTKDDTAKRLRELSYDNAVMPGRSSMGPGGGMGR